MNKLFNPLLGGPRGQEAAARRRVNGLSVRGRLRGGGRRHEPADPRPEPGAGAGAWVRAPVAAVAGHRA